MTPYELDHDKAPPTSEPAENAKPANSSRFVWNEEDLAGVTIDYSEAEGEPFDFGQDEPPPAAAA